MCFYFPGRKYDWRMSAEAGVVSRQLGACLFGASLPGVRWAAVATSEHTLSALQLPFSPGKVTSTGTVLIVSQR